MNKFKCLQTLPNSYNLITEKAEKDLFQEFLVLDHDIAQQLDSGNYLKALNLMASLRGKVDQFFEEVMVLTENCELRRNRLRLLSSISRMFLQVADISMIRQIKVERNVQLLFE